MKFYLVIHSIRHIRWLQLENPEVTTRRATRGHVYRNGAIDSGKMKSRMVGIGHTDRTDSTDSTDNSLLLGVAGQNSGERGRRRTSQGSEREGIVVL